ncbi:MAG: HlyC/CorC family transporter [Flavobacteriia bacterium]|nr:HlyC/CorC family transporter [Flavobacteriia bacterium]
MESELIIVITLIFTAFFSGMEIAFIASNRLKVEMDRSKGTLNGKILGIFYQNESHFIATLLLGNNVSLVLFGISAATLLNPIIENWGVSSEGLILLIQTTISTLLVLILAEFLPKALVQINPNGFLKFSSIIMIVVYWILYLPTQLIMFISNAFLKLVKSEGEDNSQKVFSKVDLEHYVQDINERIKEEQEFGNEMQILQNALDFSNLKARDCMVPRMEIAAIEIEESIDDLCKLFIEKGLSKIIVYRDSIENVIGYVHSFEIFKKPQSIKQILLPISFVPEVMPAKEIMELFSKQSGNIAIVVDEYGGTSGVITLEDIIEEIFGDILDEHDKEELLEQKISETEYLFSARLDIDHINEIYNLHLPESDEYETLGGLIIHKMESIPSLGDELLLEKYKYIIEQVSDRKIEIVKIMVI